MTTKQWLMRAYLLNKKIDKLLEYRSRLYATACSSTSHTNKEVVSHSRANTSEINFIKVADCGKQIDDMSIELGKIISEILSAIKDIGDPKIQTLLFQRYINFRSWDEISKQMNININTVKGKLHSRSLAELSRFIQKT